MPFLSDKRILITGGRGFLGSHLIPKLHKRGVKKEQIKVISIEDSDLRKWENCLNAVEGVDIVIHLAAKVGGIGFNQNYPAELFYDNAIMGIQLIEAARQKKIEKFVAIGTICAYPKFTPVPFKEDQLWNGYPEETNAPYGLAKKMLLVQTQSYRKQYGFNAIYLLPVNLYGPGDNFNPDSSHVIPALIKKFIDAKMSGEKEVVVWGTGEVSREFLSVEDAAEGIILATENYNDSEPVKIGAGFEIKIKELVNIIAELTEFKGEIVWDKSKPDGQPRRCLDTSMAKKYFGFEAKIELREGIKKTVKWYIENKVKNGSTVRVPV